MVDEFIKMELDLEEADPALFASHSDSDTFGQMKFSTLENEGDSEENRLRLYLLNKACSEDIPGRGAFYSWDDYKRLRIEVPHFSSAGVLLAIDGDDWIGLSVTSVWKEKSFAFAEMTGVRRDHRRLGIALELKIRSLHFARSLGIRHIGTLISKRNEPSLQLNRKIGFRPVAEFKNKPPN